MSSGELPDNYIDPTANARGACIRYLHINESIDSPYLGSENGQPDEGRLCTIDNAYLDMVAACDALAAEEGGSDQADDLLAWVLIARREIRRAHHSKTIDYPNRIVHELDLGSEALTARTCLQARQRRIDLNKFAQD